MRTIRGSRVAGVSAGGGWAGAGWAGGLSAGGLSAGGGWAGGGRAAVVLAAVVLAAVLLAAVVLAGCSSGRSTGSVGSGSVPGSVPGTGTVPGSGTVPGTGATSTPGGATSTTVAGGGGYLRGYRLSSFACPPAAGSGVAGGSGGSGGVGVADRVAASSVTALLVCALAVPDPSAGSARSVTLVPSDPAFHPLLVALAAPDGVRKTGPCPLFADVVQPVVARAGDQAVLVHLPVDGCGHYQAAVRTALARARGT